MTRAPHPVSNVTRVEGEWKGAHGGLLGPILYDAEYGGPVALTPAQFVRREGDLKVVESGGIDQVLMKGGAYRTFDASLPDASEPDVSALVAVVSLSCGIADDTVLFEGIHDEPWRTLAAPALIWTPEKDPLRAKIVSAQASFIMPRPQNGVAVRYQDALEVRIRGENALERNDIGAAVTTEDMRLLGVMVGGSPAVAYVAPAAPITARERLTVLTAEMLADHNRELGHGANKSSYEESLAKAERKWSQPARTGARKGKEKGVSAEDIDRDSRAVWSAIFRSRM